jgi:hypothetical protein
MIRYKDGSVITLGISILALAIGSVCLYYGNDRIVIKGIKESGRIKIEKTDMKLYFVPVATESLDGVIDVKFRTETAADKVWPGQFQSFRDQKNCFSFRQKAKLTRREKENSSTILIFLSETKNRSISDHIHSPIILERLGSLLQPALFFHSFRLRSIFSTGFLWRKTEPV